MMAGTGVSVGGGVGMLRTRRRDVSVKPNRKLDRKSSRGMIYENEELRLRTIHINAEVEQGQNDIKKLRRENEQLRREIWSLRDEYDKLEEILKRQKNRGESEEYEDRSEEDEGSRSEYSCEEDEEVDAEEEDERSTANGDQEERLENAENQKISTEKMNTGNPHRLHVDFDDLSVVDEEEELRKEREKKEEEKQQRQRNEARNRRQLQDNFPFYPSTYDSSSGGFSAVSCYPECPFQFPAAAIDAPAMSPCNPLFGEPRLPVTTPETSGNSTLPVLHVPSVGWQSNVLVREDGFSSPLTFGANFDGPGSSGIESSQLERRVTPENPGSHPQTFAGSAGSLGRTSNLLQRRNVTLRQPIKFPGIDPFKDLSRNSEEKTGRTVWQLSTVNSEERNDRPKHFFAPLPSKLKTQKPEEESPEMVVKQFETTNSSSSDKTDSTVVLRSSEGKGSVDLCVNGAIPCQTESFVDRDDQRTFLSTENLLVEDARRNLSEGQLTKSISCQNLATESQNISYRFEQLRVDGKPQTKLAKSDNTLDGISNDDFRKAYKTHLNVTLKRPGHSRQTSSPDIPEIPELPSIDCRVMKNPFLRSYVDSPVTQPLSIQVTDSNHAQHYANSSVLSNISRGSHKPMVQTQDSRLLIPTDQLINEKILSPLAKQEIQVTSFERPSPHTLVAPTTPYDLETLRRITTNRFLASQKLYQNVPFVPGRPYVCPTGVNSRLYLENSALKVPAQTQTSIDGDSHQEDEQGCQQGDGNVSGAESPSAQRRKKIAKKEKVPSVTSKEHSSLSPAAQRRLKKQNSTTSVEGSIPESPGKLGKSKFRKSSIVDTGDDKNESRSSSSGQDSPRKDQNRRVSVYFNAKKRPSLASVKTTRSGSIDVSRDKYVCSRDFADPGNSERERTNSVSSRDTGKQRKTSTSSGSVPWCACWGNGCV